MTDTLDRLEQLVARLERLGIAPTAPPGVEARAPYPANVTAGELIESAWGNMVVEKLRDLPLVIGNGGSTDRLLLQPASGVQTTTGVGAIAHNWATPFAVPPAGPSVVAIGGLFMAGQPAWCNTISVDEVSCQLQFHNYDATPMANQSIAYWVVGIGGKP